MAQCSKNLEIDWNIKWCCMFWGEKYVSDTSDTYVLRQISKYGFLRHVLNRIEQIYNL